MDISSGNYRKAFVDYVHRGTPIGLSLKQAKKTTHYIWRTRRDRKVRSSHAANDGKIFAWNNPPSTGHPERIMDVGVWQSHMYLQLRNNFILPSPTFRTRVLNGARGTLYITTSLEMGRR